MSEPNQGKVDAISRETLEKYEQVSLNQLRKDFEYVRKLQDGTIQVPSGSFNRVLRARLASIHTQFTRLASITGSLARRFGRAVGRALPFIGGIAILANGPEFAQVFIAAASDYARDIREGEDETGSAAILAGHCNDLAPGSGNLVLSYLLR